MNLRRLNEFPQKLPEQCWFRLVHALFSRWNQQKSNLFSFPPPNPKSQYEKKTGVLPRRCPGSDGGVP